MVGEALTIQNPRNLDDAPPRQDVVDGPAWVVGGRIAGGSLAGQIAQGEGAAERSA